MVAFDEKALYLQKTPMQHWAWGVVAAALVALGIGVFMLAGVGLLYLIRGGPCG